MHYVLDFGLGAARKRAVVQQTLYLLKGSSETLPTNFRLTARYTLRTVVSGRYGILN